jgi:hypothetical protein
VNLARRYFPVEGDPFTDEAVQLQISLFPSYKDVLLRDPKHIAVTYVKDSFQNMRRALMSTELLAFPLLLFSLPGIFILVLKPTNVFALFFLVATMLQVSLLGFKEYEPRYYLFLIPALAAGAGTCIQFIWAQISPGLKRTVALILFLPLLISGVKETRYTLAATYEDLHAQDEELGEVISAATKLVDPRDMFVSREKHLPFYLGIQQVGFPEVRNLEEFHAWLNSLSGGGTVYVYFGPNEKHNRPKSMDLGSAERAPNWLKPVARSPMPSKWILYRYDRLQK